MTCMGSTKSVLHSGCSLRWTKKHNVLQWFEAKGWCLFQQYVHNNGVRYIGILLCNQYTASFTDRSPKPLHAVNMKILDWSTFWTPIALPLLLCDFSQHVACTAQRTLVWNVEFLKQSATMTGVQQASNNTRQMAKSTQGETEAWNATQNFPENQPIPTYMTWHFDWLQLFSAK